jgi:hypothetical protein
VALFLTLDSASNLVAAGAANTTDDMAQQHHDIVRKGRKWQSVRLSRSLGNRMALSHPTSVQVGYYFRVPQALASCHSSTGHPIPSCCAWSQTVSISTSCGHPLWTWRTGLSWDLGSRPLLSEVVEANTGRGLRPAELRRSTLPRKMMAPKSRL